MGLVLVVDPVASVREALSLVLGLEGHAVHVAATGAAGLTVAARAPIDVVLVDPMLPDMSVSTFCDALTAQGSRAPVVVMSYVAATRPGPAACPGAGLLPKPFTAGELLATVAARS